MKIKKTPLKTPLRRKKTDRRLLTPSSKAFNLRDKIEKFELVGGGGEDKLESLWLGKRNLKDKLSSRINGRGILRQTN